MTATSDFNFRRDDIVVVAVFLLMSFVGWLVAGAVMPAQAIDYSPTITIMLTPAALPIDNQVAAGVESLDERLSKIQAQFAGQDTGQAAAPAQPGVTQSETAAATAAPEFVTDADGVKWVGIAINKSINGVTVAGSMWYPCNRVIEVGAASDLEDSTKQAVFQGCGL
jgi:hypothetical protein